jgi:hypothetical protein
MDKNDRLLAAEEASWRKTGAPVSRIVRTQSEARRSPVVVPVTAATGATAPWFRRSTIVIPLVAGCTLCVALVIVALMRSPTTVPTAAPPPPAGTAGTVAAPGAAGVPSPSGGGAAVARPAVGQPAVGQPATATAPAANTGPTVVLSTDEPPTPPKAKVDAETEPPRHVAVKQTPPIRPNNNNNNNNNNRQPTRPAATRLATPPTTPAVVTPTVPTVETPAVTPPKNDCNPPYYYEGSKKVFKPSCL